MNCKDKLKERKMLMIAALGWTAWGVFCGMIIGPIMPLIARLITSVICGIFYIYATGDPVEKIKAKLFPSHPDYKKDSIES